MVRRPASRDARAKYVLQVTVLVLVGIISFQHFRAAENPNSGLPHTRRELSLVEQTGVATTGACKRVMYYMSFRIADDSTISHLNWPIPF